MGRNEARTFLLNRLMAFVDADAIETVVEYLMSFNPYTEQNDMISYLEELCGKSASYGTIISSYALIFKSDNNDLKQIVDHSGLDNKNLIGQTALLEQCPKTDEIPRILKASSESKEYSARNDIPSKKSTNETISTKNTEKKNNFLTSKKLKGSKPDTSSCIKCNCMATRHKFYSSCYYCGLIFCELNNRIGCCTFCGTLVRPPASAEEMASNGADASTVAAYTHKVDMT